MDNEEYIYDEGQEQESSYSRKQSSKPSKSQELGKKTVEKIKDGSIKDDASKVKQGFNKIKSGDIKEGIGDIKNVADGFKGNDKVTSLSDKVTDFGDKLQKAGDASKKLGSKIKNASEIGEKGAKTAEKGSKLAKNLGKVEKNVGKLEENAGKIASAGGKTMKAAGDITNAAGTVADATVVGAPVGAVANVAGTLASVGGTTVDTAGNIAQMSGKVKQVSGEVKEAAATAAEQGAKLGKNASKLGKKLGTGLEKTGDAFKKTGDQVKEWGKNLKKVGDKVGNVVGQLTNPVSAAFLGLKVLLIGLVIFILCIIIFFSAVMSPLFSAMDYIKSVADMQEKYNNFMYGLGFENSIDAFNNEVRFLDKHYDNALDESLLMATLFYVDIMRDQDVTDSETQAINSFTDGDSSIWGSIYDAVDMFCDEAETETDEMGRVYSANKIFRLKKLARNMVSKTGETNTVSFKEYAALNADIIGTDWDRMKDSEAAEYSFDLTLLEMLLKLAVKGAIIFAANQIAGPLGGQVLDFIDYYLFDSAFFKIDQRTNEYLETKLGNNIEGIRNYYENVYVLLEDILTSITDIEGIEFNLDVSGYELSFGFIDGEFKLLDNGGLWDAIEEVIENGISIDFSCNLEYEVYSFDEDAYKEYLTGEDGYLRTMSEFRAYIVDKDGEISDKRVDELYTDIKALAEVWKEFNEEGDASAMFNDACIGNINPNIIEQLALPINLNEGDEVIFTNKTAFGFTVDGNMHLGVDLNEESVGVHAGDPVYAVYDGEVQTSTASGNYPEDVTGGWFSYQFNISYDINDSDVFNKTATTTVTIIYGGLDPNSVPAKGTRFNKGDIIGYIGDENASENGKPPGLHFGFIDGLLEKGRYLNPINIFITCNDDGDGLDDGIIIHPTSRLMVHEIGLKKSQFIEATNEYIKKGGRGAENLQKWDLNEVYKYSVKYNINPELIVIRAIVEGFSPSFYDSRYASYYNYWGIGCGNSKPLSSCSDYENFEMGIKGFASLDIVANADTIEEMMGRYAQIGAVWLDRVHGGSGAGGCYYIDAEEPYIRAISPARADLVRRTCDDPNYICTSASDSRCLRTIWDIDQQAHVDYNCREMNALFDEIYAPYHQGVASDQIEAYIKVMVDIANDDSHGYNQNYDRRTMNPDVDCTSLVYYGLVLSGTIPDSGGPFYTGTMGKILKANGFTEYRFDPSILQRGDIVMYHTENSDGSYSGHAITYLGDGKQVAANGCKKAPRSCDPGDQADEVSVSNFSGSNYHYIYRLEQ